MEDIENLDFGIEYNEYGVPVFIIGNLEYPILVLDYTTVQKLLGAIMDYFIESDKYYNDED